MMFSRSYIDAVERVLDGEKTDRLNPACSGAMKERSIPESCDSSVLLLCIRLRNMDTYSRAGSSGPIGIDYGFVPSAGVGGG